MGQRSDLARFPTANRDAHGNDKDFDDYDDRATRMATAMLMATATTKTGMNDTAGAGDW